MAGRHYNPSVSDRRGAPYLPPPPLPARCNGACKKDLQKSLIQLYDEIHNSMIIAFKAFADANGLDLESDVDSDGPTAGQVGHRTQDDSVPSNGAGGPSTVSTGSRPPMPRGSDNLARRLSHIMNPPSPVARLGQEPHRAPVFRPPPQQRDLAPSPPDPRAAAPSNGANGYADAGRAQAPERNRPTQVKQERNSELDNRIPRDESEGSFEPEEFPDHYSYTPHTLRTNGNGSPISRGPRGSAVVALPPLLGTPPEPTFMPRNYNGPPPPSASRQPSPAPNAGINQERYRSPSVYPESPRYEPVSPDLGSYGRPSPEYHLYSTTVSPQGPPTQAAPPQPTHASPPPQSVSQFRYRTDIHSLREPTPVLDTSEFYVDEGPQVVGHPSLRARGSTSALAVRFLASSLSPERGSPAEPSSPSGGAPPQSQLEQPSTPGAHDEQNQSSAYPSPHEVPLSNRPSARPRPATPYIKRQHPGDSDDDEEAEDLGNPPASFRDFRFPPVKRATPPRKRQRPDPEPVAQPLATQTRKIVRKRQPTPGPSRLAPPREPVRKSSRLKGKADVKGKGKAKADF